MVQFEAKEKKKGKWGDLMAKEFVGKTLREAYNMLYGRDVVMKFEGSNGIGYFVGTPDLEKKYREAGKNVYDFHQAVAGIEKGENAEILDEMMLDPVQELFADDGATFQKFVWNTDENSD